jgi:ATP-dependent DNA helicase RecG
MTKEYYAHSLPNRPPENWQPLDEHLKNVADMAKGLLPYHGLGSGIRRALKDWPDIEFTNDRDGCLFTATVHRKEVNGSDEPDKRSLKTTVKTPIKKKSSEISSEKSSEKIVDLLKSNSKMAAREIGDVLGISSRAVEKQIAKLREEGRIRSIGPAKGGYRDMMKLK